ncbi:MAG: amino acid adenylation domain-containing protein [Cytophagales bacterium]|nr:amino acid adenylation domain-containing protein [Cytophagales bacterium]MCA6366783.1 amino acid adenylation domain-containing protein [Cytophagales bacterium]MCA6370841.1 amino acid adenylation domain-containing protein [Cytophagales bacterium]MCA6375751.1 amino acid adenylation domain-containing protein [Cytophagales bacterium]MCA6384701.1 amino acid adenylation domain-containing protein [Cytophagales bacterium]
METVIQDETGFEIAVVGMAGRFPGAKNIHEFWENIKSGKESIRFFTDEELKEYNIDPGVLKNPNYVKAKGYLDNIDEFDASFFGYSPMEALKMDPQIRVFHECVWHALEDAGYYPGNYRGQIGLYGGGVSSLQWQAILFSALADNTLDWMSTELISNKDLLTTRVSYNLGLKGPSFSINTQCSTSVVAVHLACNALLAGECDMALAGGVSINLPPKTGYTYAQDMIISPDGHCRPFDAKASGTIWGDGVGVVALKRLRTAIQDKDKIYAIIKGSAINNDGDSKSNFTAPSVSGQYQVIKLAHQFADVNPQTIEYIETHGTGTALGDPIEIEALKRSFNTDKKQFCGIGSVKANIGHLISAAGIASFIKTVLALQNKQIPPSINFEKPNPKIDFENSPFYVNTELRDWKSEYKVRRAAVNSFGIGGTNAHIVLEECLFENKSSEGDTDNNLNVLVLSAKTNPALVELITEYKSLVADKTVSLDNLAFSLQTTRKHFEYRTAITYSGRTDLIKKIDAINTQEGKDVFRLKEIPNITFMFPGQGSQFKSMCSELYSAYPVFKNEVDACAEIVKKYFNVNIQMLLFDGATLSDSKINETHYAQLALFVVEYSLAKLLMSCNVKPNALIGHSIGEYVAATLSGVIQLQDAIRLVEVRGRLMQSLERGSMVSVMADMVDIEPYLRGSVSIACVNSSRLITLSGKTPDIDDLIIQLECTDLPYTKIKTSHAFHSSMVDPIVDLFVDEVRKVTLAEPTLPYISNMTGDWITKDEATDPLYYGKHLRHCVQFEKGISTILNTTHTTFIEVGPGNALTGFVKRHRIFNANHTLVATVRQERESVNDCQKFLDALGNLWKNGVDVDFKSVLYLEDRSPAKIRLPLYPFQRKRFWPQSNIDQFVEIGREDNAMAKKDINDWFYHLSWQKSYLPLDMELGKHSFKWLILLDDKDFGDYLHLHLEKENQHVVLIYKSDAYEKLDDGRYLIDIKEQDHFYHVFENEFSKGNQFDFIVNALPVEKPTPLNVFSRALEENVFKNFYSNLHLVRAYARVSGTKNLKLLTLTNNTFEVTGNEIVDPYHSLAIGVTKVVPSEYSMVQCKFIDTDLYIVEKTNYQNVLQQLVREVLKMDEKSIVAYRNNIRWEQVLVKRAPNGANTSSILIRENGVYVITGGLGIFGFKFSEYLQKHNIVKLALLTRSVFPDKGCWHHWRTYSLAEILSFENLSAAFGLDRRDVALEIRKDIYNKIIKIGKVEAAGATVDVFQCEISDDVSVENCFSLIEKTLGPINGIIHGAGYYQYTPIASCAYGEINSILSPKVQGTLALFSCLKNRCVEFVMLHSSLSAVIPLKDFSAYSAANLFLDAFAAYMNSVGGVRTVAVNWDIFKLREDEIGAVTAEEEENSRRYLKFLKDGIGHEEGGMLFDRVLHEINTQVIISRNDLLNVQRIIDMQNDHVGTTEPTNNNARTSIFKRPNLTVQYMEPQSTLQEEMCIRWAEVLGYDKIGVLDDFFELGGNSLQALTIINRLSKEKRVDLSFSEFFKKTSIESLAAYIVERKKNNTTPFQQTAIERTAKKDFYCLSSPQQRIYFLYEMDKGSLAYNMPEVVELLGTVDKDKLEDTFRKLIHRHESLRTSIVMRDEMPHQEIAEEVPFSIEYFESDESGVETILKKFVRPFDLTQAPLLRVGLIKIVTGHQLLLIDIHHIINDGVTRGVLIKEFMSFYNNEELHALTLQYKDYAEWQQSHDQKMLLLGQRDFWKSQFQDEITALNLPMDYVRPKVKTYAGSTCSFSLTFEETKKIIATGEAAGATPFMTLLSIFNILLSKLSYQSEITIGTGVAGRGHADLESVIGMFVNSLPLRNYPKPDLTFREFLSDVKNRTLACFDNQFYPYEELIKELNIPRDTSRNPLFDVMLVYQNFPLRELSIPGLTLKPRQNSSGISKFDLTLVVAEAEGKLSFDFEYATDLFKRETIERFVAYLKQIVYAVINEPNIKLEAINLLSADERNKVLYEFNDTSVPYPKDKTIIQLLLDQVERKPNNVALSDANTSLTYKQLWERTDQLADFLVTHGAEGKIIGVFADKSVDTIVWIISILKSGGAYLTLDINSPEERLKYMLDDANVNIVVANKFVPENISKEYAVFQTAVIQATHKQYQRNVGITRSPDDLAYVMYTSGTTGRPKGVMVTNRNVLRLVINSNFVILNNTTKVLLTGAMTFDATTFEIWGALLNGGSLTVVPENVVLDSDLLRTAIREFDINTMFITTTLFNYHAQEQPETFEGLRILMVGGEALSPFHIYKVKELLPKLQLINGYGPTENTTFSTAYSIVARHEHNIPLGSPIGNSSVYILDAHHQPVPIGVPGELVVGGDGVALGYLNNDVLTTEKFIDNPYRLGERMYKTGDLARWLPDGRVEFLGRLDDQVKIRGYRIELGEIESQLRDLAWIKDVVVQVKERAGDKYLVAYYVAGEETSSLEMKNYLSSRLPDYMIPSQYVRLESIPMTANGKLNRKALPEPEFVIEDDYVAPSGEIEEVLVEIWSEILGIDKNVISVNKNFFELGGNSIKIIQLKSSINKRLQYTISMVDLFKCTTIYSMVEFINNGEIKNEKLESAIDAEVSNMEDLINSLN